MSNRIDPFGALPAADKAKAEEAFQKVQTEMNSWIDQRVADLRTRIEANADAAIASLGKEFETIQRQLTANFAKSIASIDASLVTLGSSPVIAARPDLTAQINTLATSVSDLKKELEERDKKAAAVGQQAGVVVKQLLKSTLI